MSKLNRKLLFGLCTIVIIVLIGLGIVLGQTFKGFYLKSYDLRVENEINLLSTLIEKDSLSDTVGFNETINDISRNLKMSISVFDGHKKVIVSSSNKNGKEINLTDSQRNKFFKELRKKNNSILIKNSASGQRTYGKQIEDPQGNKRYILVNYSIASIKDVYKSLWMYLFSLLGITIFTMIILIIRYSNQFSRPIDEITQVALELAKGNYKARIYSGEDITTSTLSEAMNVLAKNLQKMTLEQEMQQDRLNTLIQNIGSGVVLINSRGTVNLVNRTYEEIFNMSARFIEGELYHDAFQHHEIIEIVEQIFLKEIKIRKQIVLPLKIVRKHFEVYGAPIIGINHEWKGIVLVFHDITELKKLEQIRKDFFANVSHELKTPITSIKGFTETLLDGAMKDQALCENFLSIILSESDRMQSLIQDLLDLSKIEQQGFKLEISKVNLQTVIDEIFQMLSQKAQEKNIEFKNYIKNPLIVAGDALRLKQVFINLIDNALLYTQSGGKVFITASETENSVSIRVSDTGVGIGKEEIPRIFERFYRVDKARSRNSGGTGLGLAIVKHLVEAHKGNIEVESRLGQGTTFIVTLNKKNIQ